MDAGTPARSTPILVGVGQFNERIDAPDYRALSAVQIAAEAARAACDDALSLDRLRPFIDVVATTRTFDDSREATPVFGTSTNFPRSVARRLDLEPRLAVWEKVGGDSPQVLVNHFCERIARNDVRMVLLAGGEAISTARHFQKQGRQLDWSESPEGDVEDHGRGVEGLITAYNQKHGLIGAPLSYALLEHARRARLGLSREAYEEQMGALFAPFTAVAAANRYAAFSLGTMSAEDIADPVDRNRMIADPYRLRMVAKDQVNQGAAVLLTSVGTALDLGIPPSRWVYLHGYSELTEREIMQRADLGSSPAAQRACEAAFGYAGIDAQDCGFFDFYSCFPIAVSNVACDGLGLAPDDVRGFTVTGGLPFFGGPGNNYSMHAIATMVERLRAHPERYGFVGANGGYLSKYAAGVYSARPAAWKECSSASVQAGIDALPVPAQAGLASGSAIVESFTVNYRNGTPTVGIVAARTIGAQARLLAITPADGDADLHAMVNSDPLGRRIEVTSSSGINTFRFI